MDTRTRDSRQKRRKCMSPLHRCLSSLSICASVDLALVSLWRVSLFCLWSCFDRLAQSKAKKANVANVATPPCLYAFHVSSFAVCLVLKQPHFSPLFSLILSLPPRSPSLSVFAPGLSLNHIFFLSFLCLFNLYLLFSLSLPENVYIYRSSSLSSAVSVTSLCWIGLPAVPRIATSARAARGWAASFTMAGAASASSRV